jgi:cell division initiation protein
MEISPVEITQREFGRKMRGLDPEEVHTFLEQIAEEMTRLLQQNSDQSAQIQRLEAQVKGYQEREDSLRNTLVTAQKMTEEIKENAKREGALIIKEAELRAENLLEQAHQKLGQVQAETAELRRQRDLFAAKLRGLLKTHLDLLEAQPDRPTPLK